MLLNSGMFDNWDTDPDTKRKLMNSVATMGIAGNALCKLPVRKKQIET